MALVKPGYSGIPVITDIDRIISQDSLLSALNSYQSHKSFTPELANQWLIHTAWSNLHRWSWESMKATLGYRHWYEVPPNEFYQWADEHHIAYLVPRKYLTARQR